MDLARYVVDAVVVEGRSYRRWPVPTEATCPVGMKIIGGGFSAIGDDAAMRVAIGDRAAIAAIERRGRTSRRRTPTCALRSRVCTTGRAADPPTADPPRRRGSPVRQERLRVSTSG